MELAASDGGWWEFHKRAAVMGLPQIPDAGVVARHKTLIDGHDERVLLLGVTRSLSALGKDLTVVDLSETQIEQMWPGDCADRRAVLGDWRGMEPPEKLYTAAIGDGSLSTLHWPDDYRNVLGRVAGAIESGGILAIRCFIAPDVRETLDEIVEEVLSGRERDWNATRWRIAMAAAREDSCIAARDLASTWLQVFPPLPELAERTGWDLDGMEMLLDSFARASLRFSFVTRSALLSTLPASLANARFVSSGDYPLSERCPFLVAERAG